MITHISAAPGASNGFRNLWNRVADALDTAVGHTVLALAARFGIAGIFLMSGRTKVDGWLSMNDIAVALFADEYKVPILSPGRTRRGVGVARPAARY
jgi:putative oxidoreductase